MRNAAGIAGLQAAVDAPGRVAGVQLLDVSLRMLHTKKQAAWQRPLVTAFQRLLRETQLGKWFFATIAKPDVRPPSISRCNIIAVLENRKDSPNMAAVEEGMVMMLIIG